MRIHMSVVVWKEGDEWWAGKMSRMRGGLRGYRTPASLRAFWRIVSFTAAKTRRILLVSVACVKLQVSIQKQRDNVLWIHHHI
jgi:hypothetical protein